MRRALAILVFSAMPALAWNSTGHRIVAAIAYDQLTPATRARVDDLIRRHPDYQLFLEFAPRESAARARAAFIAASTWADQIKFDQRFKRKQTHADWHYINIGFSQDGTPLLDAPKPNVVTALEQLSRNLDPEALVWTIHLVGDIHNPLHTATRFTRQDPEGDRGGNSVYVQPGRNLHSYWDGLPGPDAADSAYVDNQARQLKGRPSSDLRQSFAEWAKEGVELAKKVVYAFGQGVGASSQPVRLSRSYQEDAKSLARVQLVTAGQRLAVLLNGQLP